MKETVKTQITSRDSKSKLTYIFVDLGSKEQNMDSADILIEQEQRRHEQEENANLRPSYVSNEFQYASNKEFVQRSQEYQGVIELNKSKKANSSLSTFRLVTV